MPAPVTQLMLCLAALIPGDAEPLVIAHRAYAAGEEIRFETRVELQLSATVMLGFVAQQFSYRLLEEETLIWSQDPDGDEPQQRLSYPLARRTSVAPLVGKRIKDRRVAGKSYVVRLGEDGLAVFSGDGSPAGVKEAREVLRSCFAVGRQPPLFAILPAAEVSPGAVFRATGPDAKRVLGLGLDELAADELALTLRDDSEGDQLLFDASATLSGEAELAGRWLTLNAELEGTLVASRSSGRLLQLELSGPLSVTATGGSEQQDTAGTGTLTVRRSAFLPSPSDPR